MSRTRALVLLLIAGACSRPAPAPVDPSPAPPGAAVRSPDDVPLPDPDEVPEFLQQRPGEPVALAVQPAAAAEEAPPADREPSLAELLQQVHEGDGEEESFAYVTSSREGGASVVQDPPPAVKAASDQEEPSPSAPDPCAEVRARIEVRRGYLERVAAERNRFAYVEGAEDASALRLLESLRRCEAHPDDPDCKAPPVERDPDELVAAPGTVERQPSELAAGDGGAEVVHDPGLITLLRELATCERRKVAQPLLER